MKHQYLNVLSKHRENKLAKGLAIKSRSFLVVLCLSLFSQITDAADADRLKVLEAELAESRLLLKALADKVNNLQLIVENTKPQSLPKDSKTISSNLEENSERLEILEDTMLDVEEKIGSRAVVNAFDSLKLDIGGFFHSAFTYVNGEDSNASSFNRQNFELLISAELNKQWSGFFAGGFLREADDPFSVGNIENPAFNSKNKNPLIIGWVNFSQSDEINVRIGRFITPHGIINIEHFPATLLDPEQPQILRPFSGDTIFPNFSTGVQLHGSTYFNNDHKLQYYVYVSNFAGNPEENRTGAMLEYEFTENLTFGVNLGQGERASGNDYSMIGAHLLFEQGKLVWKTEYYSTDEDDLVSQDRSGGYTQPSWNINPEWSVFYRYDMLDSGIRDTRENAFGVNYLPYPNIRLRAIYTQKTFKSYLSGNTLLPKADADTFQLSGTFSF